MPPYHTALRAVFLVAIHHGAKLEARDLAIGNDADVMGSALTILRNAGLDCAIRKNCAWTDITKQASALPLLAIDRAGRWLIVSRVVKSRDGGPPSLLVLDPETESTGAILMTRQQFLGKWSGVLVTCASRRAKTETQQPFGLMWFLPEIMRHWHYFRDVALAATMCNLIAFVTPLLYHVIIDKAIPHQGYNTLYFVLLVFAVATVFEAIFSYLRQYLMLFATNKIDANLASRTYHHLLGLPLNFFEKTPAGILTRHMQQTEKLRHFLTGRLFQTLLDAAALPFLLVVLMMYSVKLTALVFGFSLVIALVIGVMVPTFRNHLNHLYQAEGARQAHLIETVHGMRTIKTLCAETVQQKSWDKKVVSAVRRNSKVGRIGALANVLTTSLDKIMQVSILGLGALDVFDGNMTIGALVAFTMLSGRVSGPLVQIVGLINEYQETALSVRMLGSVMDHPTERDTTANKTRPLITGDLEFSQVSFKYPGAATPALDRVSFKVPEGSVIGVVGRSGSGKTTITRLIQAIHAPQDGLIRFNNVDVRHIDLAHLRRSVGVVLQDSFLFRGTIAQNIAAGRPNAPLGDIVEAARLAGAEEFIDRLAMSYDTMLEEGASNLSGGQRQRIAIARALLLRPRLLIFDEATSALDPESEAIIQANLAEIARGRTMIIVSHRLSSLVTADAILVLDQGRVIDFAPHDVLLEHCKVYAHLWYQQTKHTAPTQRTVERVAAYGR
ncbi:MAG: peptidase domain-containing ABC transporter [Hyphomicrobium sp.]